MQEMETREFEENTYKEVSNESAPEEQIQPLTRALDTGDKVIKSVALGLCQWKDGYLWHYGRIWIPNSEGIRTNHIPPHHNIPQASY